jgi:hypothetical protein
MHTNADGNVARSNQNAAAALKAMLTSGEVGKIGKSNKAFLCYAYLKLNPG